MKKSIKVLFCMTTLISIQIYINNLIFKKSNKKIDFYEDNFYDWKFGKIRYIKKGKGDPILLLHDTKSYSGINEWLKNIDILSDHYTVYAIDLLGYGYSNKPNLSYNSYLYVSLINDFTKNIIKEQTYVVAKGNTSQFVLCSYILNKDYFKKILLVSPTILTTKYPNILNKFLRTILDLPVLGTTIYNILNSRVINNLKMKTLFHNYAKYNDFKYLMYYYSHSKGSASKFSNSSFLNKYLNSNVKNNINKIDIPVHIIWGELDEINPIENYNDITDINPNITLSIINNSKSMPQIENPLQFYKICRKYFSA